MQANALVRQQPAPLVLEIAQKRTEKPWNSLSPKQKLIVLLGVMATLRNAPVSTEMLMDYSEALSRENFDDAVKALEYFACQPRLEKETAVPSVGLLLDRIHRRGSFAVVRISQIKTLDDLKRENQLAQG